ncbi:MAG: COR domain-containing protein [Saprospiraceae bacterium]
MKPNIIQQIEKQTGKPLTQLTGLENLADAVRYKHNHSYAMDGGKLVALNVTETESLNRVEFDEGDCATLQHLNLSENKNLQSVTFAAALPQLKYLDLSECKLGKLTLPAGCDQLEKAWLQKSGLQTMSFEGPCPELLLLDLSENQLKELALPDGFGKLAYFYLKGNQLSALHFPPGLPALDTLHLEENQLKSFSEDILISAPALTSLYLKKNPLPDAMRGTIEESSGNSSIDFLKRYFKDMAKGSIADNECKVLLIGNGNVGKTCLAERLVNNTFLGKWESTHGIVLRQYPLKEYLLNLWDFAGQDIYHATHRLFMQSGAVYLVLWDAQTEQKTHTPYHHHGEERQFANQQLPYWLDYAQYLGQGSPVIVVQTKTGKDGKQDLPLIREAYQTRFSFLDFQHIESEEDDWDENGLNQLNISIRRAVKRIKNSEEIPENWVRLRQTLRDKQVKGEKRLSLTDYLAMPEVKDLEDEPLNVLENWLVKTGVVFYRKGMFQNEIILDQAWAIQAIYTLFDRDSFFYSVLQARKGSFTGKDLSRIWAANSESERELFVSFMLACEMCFETTPKEKDNYRSVPFEERQFVAPQLMDEQVPKSVSDVWMGRRGLHLHYRHEFLHYGVIQSFIVRTQSLAEMRDIWRYGISLREGDKLAMVEAPDKTVHVVVTENGKPLLDKIRNMLEELQDNKGEESVSLDGEHFVGLDKLKNHPADNPKIETDTPGEWVDVKPFSVFLNKDEKASFNAEKPEGEIHPDLFIFKTSEDMKKNIQDLIANARLADALSLLASFAPAGEVIQLQSRLTELERKERMGIISSSEAGLERNKITTSALALCDQPSKKSVEPHETEKKSKILFLAANPTDQSRIQTDREHRLLKAQMERGRSRDRYEFLPPQFAVTIDELLRAMNDQPNIVHFSGHGETRGIVITTDDNKTQLMSVPALKRLFKDLKNICEIVVLNACYSAEQAEEISKFGMYVVGNNLPIADSAAISFSKGLYNGLGEGKHFEKAFNDAMIVVETENPSAAGIIEVWKDGKKLDL